MIFFKKKKEKINETYREHTFLIQSKGQRTK